MALIANCDTPMRRAQTQLNALSRASSYNLNIREQRTLRTRCTQRAERRDVRGAPGWQVNANGEFFLHRKRRETGGKLAPTIDLGADYVGLIPVAYGHAERITDANGESRVIVHRERFVDEIVCWTFHGPPPSSISGMCVVHLDGDGSNCSAANLRWYLDPEHEALQEENRIRRLMRPDHLPLRMLVKADTNPLRRLLFTTDDSISGHMPKPSEQLRIDPPPQPSEKEPTNDT
ncbi:hypothetical protein GO011_06985 [Mycobacterium sp. 20091114027_K0903767]|nr:hypothetical protein [Mycobacterium sp. 20091114027_K0903767]